MHSTFRICLLVAMALALAPMAFANDSVSADVLQTIQKLSSHPAASKDSYARYEDALDRAAAYADANPESVLQVGHRSRQLPAHDSSL